MATYDSRDDTTLSEIDIQALVDGQLDKARTDALHRYLQGRPDEARRVAFYDKLNGHLQRSFSESAYATDSTFVPNTPNRSRWERLKRRVADKAMARLGRRVGVRASAGAVTMDRVAAIAIKAASVRIISVIGGVAVVCVTLGAGLAVSMPLSRFVESQLDRASVMAFANEANRDPETATDGAAAAGIGTAAIGAAAAGGAAAAHPVVHGAPDLVKQGFRLTSASDLSVIGPWHARQYTYRDGDRHVIVLLTAPDPVTSTQPQWHARRVGSLRLLGWTLAGTHYVLVGDADTHGLMQAADQIVARK